MDLIANRHNLTRPQIEEWFEERLKNESHSRRRGRH